MVARSRIALAFLTVLLALSAGCGSEPAASVDTAALNPGNYPTTPRDLAALRTADAGAVRESIRLGSIVPLPMDLDSRLVHGRTNFAGHHYTARNPPFRGSGISNLENFGEQAPGLIAGWHTGGSRRANRNFGLDVAIALLRFTTPEQATHAMHVLADKGIEKYPPKQTLEIPGYPTGRTYLTAHDSVQSWTARGDYLLWTFVSDGLATPPDPAPLLAIAKKLFDRQFEQLDHFTPTPVEKLSDTTVDALLARTLAAERPGTLEDVTGVYTAPAALHLESRPDLTRRAFEDAGVDLIAYAGTRVYRASDPAAAARLTAALAAQVPPDYDPIDSPPGLPDASCFREEPGPPQSARIILEHRCYFSHDRYVAEVTANQPQDLAQRASAQYLLLAHGSAG
ncbi:DUF7373 family lipoprotein [Nocardia amikacinitolerans]|uniref:DUF7373 family lipoprotein n=1 Tax=Nocardia amikacinitolerans TaxID=756689 RepID=UPI0020A4B49F|nr:hypothetical protein [Nocardia amikacinitolerans]MCP2277092.1 hypothetical protein [Nocardia amikacinitolerans]